MRQIPTKKINRHAMTLMVALKRSNRAERDTMLNKNIDWESAECSYRAGLLSIRGIARKYGTKEGTIRSRAKKRGWVRDLAEQVERAVTNKLSHGDSSPGQVYVQSPLEASNGNQERKSDAEIIEQASNEVIAGRKSDDEIIALASDEVAAMTLRHRNAVAMCWPMYQRLMHHLEQAGITSDNRLKFARTLKTCMDVLEKAITMERKLYNIDDQPARKSDLSELLDVIEHEGLAVESPPIGHS